MAAKVADFFHQPGLREKFMALKSMREQADRNRDARDQRRDWKKTNGPVPPAREDYSERQMNARLLQSSQPPPPIHRPGLTTAKPSNEPSPFSRRPIAEESPLNRQYSPAHSESPPPEKRKRAEDDNDDYPINGPSDNSSSKRRALEDTPEPRNTSTALLTVHPFRTY